MLLFFKGIACLPCFKSRYDSRQTFRVPQHVEAHKINRKIARYHAKRARRRYDFCHKTTTKLAKRYALVATEDLRVCNMTRSARGTIDVPGTNVAQKLGLNRMILGRGIALLEKSVPAAGLAVAACGDSSADGSVKQEPETLDEKSGLAKAAGAA